MYKQYIDLMTGEVVTQAIIRTTDGTCIPFDPDNTDYQEFLRWCEAGNTPEPADQPE